MKTLIIALCLASGANAAELAKPQYGLVKPTLTKLEAVKLILTDSKAVVYKCTQVEMNDKMSLVNVKAKK